MVNLPNTLTLARICLVPVLITVHYLPYPWAGAAAATIFVVAALTDWLDGWLARRLDQTSRFGAFLDPVADKIMVAAALVLLVQADPRAALALPAVIIIGREIAVSALRELMAELGQRAKVAVATVGKVKTAAQMTAIALMLYHDPIAGLPVYRAGFLLLQVAAVLTLWSMLVYLRAAWPLIGPRASRDSL
ncbi:MAG: CDP-diacylglycerol--glycerol-3-phosphate 3-phosphatidyltransferase [Ectothiorhodospiraceae bacterium]|nr:CDP-diacylglycerol--glycerol-3-phosphate 3-phosphatidyltransferase [Ectothiorhodospiraceae bacterium]